MFRFRKFSTLLVSFAQTSDILISKSIDLPH